MSKADRYDFMAIVAFALVVVVFGTATFFMITFYSNEVAVREPVEVEASQVWACIDCGRNSSRSNICGWCGCYRLEKLEIE